MGDAVQDGPRGRFILTQGKQGHRPSAVAAPIALVTGAGRGIGRAVADRFGATGYTVVLAEARATLGRRAEQALRKRGAQASFVYTDVADFRSVQRLVRVVLERFGRIDCLVNNAGVLAVGPLVRVSVAALDRMLAINLRGPMLLTRAVLPTMLRQRSGSIVNVASQLGKFGAAAYAAYCASKFGLVGFTEALAEELARTNVRVWAVCPGRVDTPMARLTGIRSHERRGLIRPESVACSGSHQAPRVVQSARPRDARALFHFYRWATRVQRLQKEVPF